MDEEGGTDEGALASQTGQASASRMREASRTRAPHHRRGCSVTDEGAASRTRAWQSRVIFKYRPSTKVSAIVAGQMSVKAPECVAFESFLPEDVHIVSCPSLHGLSILPRGPASLILIQHCLPVWVLHLVENILHPFSDTST